VALVECFLLLLQEKQKNRWTKSLQNITGVQNNATYNWQQWFDTALKTKYDKDLELGYTTASSNRSS
jgi:hypothetical protein